MELPSRDEILMRANQLSVRPVAIEAWWDGDSSGWSLCLDAIIEEPSDGHPQYSAVQIATLQDTGGDLRLFNGVVPPWPESAIASEVGKALAERFGVEFWFPSPDQPRDGAARWWERNGALPCTGCGTLIVERISTPLKGLCGSCYSFRQRDEMMQSG